MSSYNPKAIEPKWQEYWDKNQTFAAKDDATKEKFYALIEFPYPSGAGLHVGHPRPFTAMDVVSRKRRMQGQNVLFPIGFDAFGLPTENYAIKTGRPPVEVTEENIATFTRQLKSLGFGFDWSRKVDTTDPAYYKWTQWIFLQFFKHGLAYKKNMPINWCPKDKIGLANEEVVDGKCERCGEAVEKRDKEQWMLAITKYADSLLQGLKEVDYIERAKVQQENWIGRSEGAEIEFGIKNYELRITVFTTRPDTVFGVTFLAISAELAQKWIDSGWEASTEIKKYIQSVLQERVAFDREEQEKTGIDSGIQAINPVSGEEVPVWITNYVMGNVGTGAIMGVPAHDKRDWDFAKKFDLKITPVIYNSGSVAGIWDEEKQNWRIQQYTEEWNEQYALKGKLVNSGEYTGLKSEEATEKIIHLLEEKQIGKRQINFKLRDWVFSRQRYWGEPIPLVHCETCEEKIKNNTFERMLDLSEGERNNPGWFPIGEEKLPLTLPKVEKYEPTDTGESPLAAMTDWVATTCPKCGGPAKRETDTMPNWAGSSWYFLRYVDPTNDKALASSEALKYWTPVDWYNGGMEHTVLHLLYSRFWNQFLFDIGVVPTKEPYKKRTSHGMILAEDGQKMSKSRGNVVNPDEMVEKFGADALRTYIMFMGPFDQAVAWDTNGLVGVKRFLDRVWNLQEKIGEAQDEKKLTSILHQTIKKVTEDIEAMRFNTAIAKMMEFINEASREESISKELYLTLITLLSPFAPHLTEELWEQFGNSGSIALASWPVFDENLAKEDTITIAVQINGKLRATFAAPAEISEEEAKQQALSEENVQKYLEGKNPQKIIYIKGKLVSIVV